MAGIAVVGMGTKCTWEAPIGEIHAHLCETYANWHKNAVQDCLMQPHEFLRHQCFARLSADNTALTAAKNQAYMSYVNCDASGWDLAKELAQQITEVATRSAGANFGIPLGNESQSNFFLPAEHAGGGQYVLTENALVEFDFGYGTGTQEGSEIEGSFSLGLESSPEGGYVGTVNEMDISFKVGSQEEEVHVAQDPEATPGWVELSESGEGTMMFLAKVDNEFLGNPVMWVEIPFSSEDPEVEIIIDTNGMVESAQLFPVTTIGEPGDCNGDGVSDEDELLEGAPDCDSDGVPDICQIGGEDCNGNDQLDRCDISEGLLSDENGDAIADECVGEVLFKQAGAGPVVFDQDDDSAGGCSCRAANDAPMPLWALVPLGFVLLGRVRRTGR